ncbi:MAG: haloalkane dehalogenase [Nitriliruptorales bacterium]
MVFTVRTDDERFADLPDFPYEPRYVEVEDLRLARVDEGEGHPVVLVHGEPTWSFLWRKVLPPLLDAGSRVVVPDQVGFGRSDKPARRDWYSYDRLVESFTAHLDAAGLDEPVTLVVHDWGGPVGLRWAVENPDRVARLVILDTGLYSPGGRMSRAWQAFRDFVESTPDLPIGGLVQGGAATDLPDEVVAAYEAPFPDAASKAGASALPLLVPLSEQDPGAAEMSDVRASLHDWDRPTLVLWGADDPVLPPQVGEFFVRVIPGAIGVETVPGGHFLQEDAGEAIGERIARFVAET